MKQRKEQVHEYRADGSLRIKTIHSKPSLTQQQHKDRCDASKIVERYARTGELVHVRRQQGAFADLTNITDYHDAMNKVIKAKAAFDQLPSKIRAEFDNDPQKLINFMNDKKNLARAVELGLAEAPIIKNPAFETKKEETVETKK